jgi:cobalamin biosynthesis Mg chelatase CobN
LIALRKICICLCLATTTSLGTSALASADPSGSEYLPSVPSATGHHAVGGGQSGQSGQSQASVSNTTDTPESAPVGASKSDKQKSGGAKDKTPGAKPAPIASTDTASSDGGSSSLPIILLIVAGVVVAAVGMTLRRRQGGGSDPGDDEGDGSDESNTPRTPDGEIVADQDEAA